jgi:hypothetical protein
MTDGADIAAQFAAFVHAPIPYIAEAILIAGVVWALSRTFIRDTMDALRERLNLATDRLHRATEEADEIRKQLSAAQDLLRGKATPGQIESATASAQTNVVELLRANNEALGALATPLRQRLSIPSATGRVAPITSKGAASKPDIKK